jgi:hypothetical protein
VSPPNVEIAHYFGSTGDEIGGLLSTSGKFIVTPSTAFKGKDVAVTWKYGGKPNELANISMKIAKPRRCDTIWHSVEVLVSCKKIYGILEPQYSFTVKGSDFPSHRLWNGMKLEREIKQGPFDSLWNCDPTSPGLVAEAKSASSLPEPAPPSSVQSQ